MALPPQNIEAEQGAIGSMLIDNDVIDDVAAAVSAAEYYRDCHGILHETIIGLYASKGKVDALILYDELVRVGKLDEAGGVDYLEDVVRAVPHAANGAYYAGIVRSKAVARRLIEASNATLRDAYSNQFTPDELVDRAMSRALDLSVANRRGGLLTNAEVLAMGMDQIDRRSQGIVGVCTGWTEVDATIDGMQPGHMILLAGRPSMGKSSGALNVAVHAAAECGVPTLLALLEAGPGDFGVRQLSHVSGLSSYALKNPKGLDAVQMVQLTDAYEKLRTAPLTTLHGTQSATNIAAAARKLKRSGLKLVIIDYIQRIRWDGDARASRQEQVSQISRAIANLAIDLDIPVLALAQLNRGVEDRKNNVPMLSDLRESGELENDASEVILMHRPDYYDPTDRPGVIELIVAKNRNGAVGKVECEWCPATYCIKDKVPSLGAPPAVAGPGIYYPPADETIEARPF